MNKNSNKREQLLKHKQSLFYIILGKPNQACLPCIGFETKQNLIAQPCIELLVNYQ